MRFFLLASIAMISVQTSFSQINKGQWLMGGRGEFASQKQGKYKQTHFTISPDAGYFLADKFAAGLRANFTNDNPSGSSANSSFSVAPFARYYFLPVAQTVNVFADAEYGFGSGKSGGSSSSINEFTVSAGPALFLNPNVALEFGLYYSSYGGKYYTGAGSDRLNTFGLEVGFQIHLGQNQKKK